MTRIRQRQIGQSCTIPHRSMFLWWIMAIFCKRSFLNNFKHGREWDHCGKGRPRNQFPRKAFEFQRIVIIYIWISFAPHPQSRCTNEIKKAFTLSLGEQSPINLSFPYAWGLKMQKIEIELTNSASQLSQFTTWWQALRNLAPKIVHLGARLPKTKA